jgi:putative spermidine/putrescine transport system ATP-binding protein/spermidine/putrescine transport system ATP-binding protein
MSEAAAAVARMSGPAPAGVRFESVEKEFGGVTALHALDLDVTPGILFSLLGPSGCGKTTTLRLIAGFEQPTTGKIFIGGRNVTGIPAYKRNFGMVFQNFALFPHLTVGENVAFGLEMRKEKKADIQRKVKSTLALVALESFIDRYPRQLSGGQQQRVALARAVAFEPDVLLLDEPLSALDKMLREQMQVEIRELQKRLGMTTVFVTHDQEEALTMSDQVAVMNNGRIQQVGAPREIYDRPRTEFIATFLGASNIIVASVTGRDGDAAVVDLGGVAMRVSGAMARPGEKLKLGLRPEKIAVRPGSALKAKLRSILFRGAQTQLFLDFHGTSINAVVFNDSIKDLSLQPGAEVDLDWHQDNMMVLEQ